MIVEGIPISEHTQDLDISSILECIEVKINTKLGRRKSSDANIMMRLRSPSVALDYCIQNLLGYILKLDEGERAL